VPRSCFLNPDCSSEEQWVVFWREQEVLVRLLMDIWWVDVVWSLGKPGIERMSSGLRRWLLSLLKVLSFVRDSMSPSTVEPRMLCFMLERFMADLKEDSSTEADWSWLKRAESIWRIHRWGTLISGTKSFVLLLVFLIDICGEDF